MPDWSSAYEEHGPSILAYLNRHVGRREEAEDLFHETFARAMGASAGIRDRSKLRAYLMQTAHNLLANHFRRPRHLVRSESDFGDQLRLEEVADRDQSPPEAAVHLRELQERVEQALSDLPPDQRRAFELGVLQRRPYREVGAELGWTVSRVKINVFRARKQLIGSLRELRGDRAGEA